MKLFEVNGSLREITNYDYFFENINNVYWIFLRFFGEKIMSRYEVYIDNATAGSGYTPVMTPVWSKYIIIKLGIDDFSNKEQIIWQLSHELCHYVVSTLAGITRKIDETKEEPMSAAMAICVINILCPQSINKWKDYLKSVPNENYRAGYTLAEEINYDIASLRVRINEYAASLCI